MVILNVNKYELLVQCEADYSHSILQPFHPSVFLYVTEPLAPSYTRLNVSQATGIPPWRTSALDHVIKGD